MREKIHKIGKYLLLHFALVLYSFTSVLSKTAGKFPLISWQFICIYGSAMLFLVIYAVLWQQILKRMPLSTAFANKAIVIIWGIVWGMIFFKESIRWNMIFGIVLIIAGIMLVGGEEQDD
jgi:drug/metabolite transporter (DMT)-like permease